MEITRHLADEQLTLLLKGRLDGAWSEHVALALNATLEEGWHHLRLDLAEVTFLSSAGIRTLVVHYKRLGSLQGLLALVNPSAPVREVLEMAGLASLIGEPTLPKDLAFPVETNVRDFGSGKVERFPMDPTAVLTPTLLEPGKPACFPGGTLGLGLGSLGNETVGEFLAVAGAALTQPGDGKQSTDFLLTQRDLIPSVNPLSGIVASSSSEASFAACLRFESHEASRGIPLSQLVELMLEEAGASAIGFALAAETEQHVGAALFKQPEEERGMGEISLEFPEVRDRMLFTVEPAWPRSVSLAVGFATRGTGGTGESASPLASQLRPLRPGDDSAPLAGHIHAAAFPYRPLTKGILSLENTVRQLLDNDRALGLLHLLNDWRPGGLGESRFYRGALWIAPLEVSL